MASTDGGGLTVEDVWVEAGAAVLLRGVSIGLRRGEVCGLIGRNGAGKSTLLKVMARQVSAARGAVRLDGRPVSAMGARPFARAVAFLRQTPPPAHGLTVRELAGFGRYAWHGALGRRGAADKAAVEGALAATGTAALADRLVSELSGGERQRAWIAQVVAQEPSFALLDEPTSALDLGHQIEVMGLLRRLSRERGLGLAVVLHDVNLAARFCDRVVALHAGEVVSDGAPDALMTPASLRAVYGTEIVVMRHPARGIPIGVPA